MPNAIGAPKSALIPSFASARTPLVDLSQYLPILLFIGVALALSVAFVVLPMIVAKLTGAAKPTPANNSQTINW